MRKFLYILRSVRHHGLVPTRMPASSRVKVELSLVTIFPPLCCGKNFSTPFLLWQIYQSRSRCPPGGSGKIARTSSGMGSLERQPFGLLKTKNGFIPGSQKSGSRSSPAHAGGASVIATNDNTFTRPHAHAGGT
jgi:hypothetical protein